MFPGQRTEGIDLRIGSDLSRILMDETDSIVSAAMAHMPEGPRVIAYGRQPRGLDEGFHHTAPRVVRGAGSSSQSSAGTICSYS